MKQLLFGSLAAVLVMGCSQQGASPTYESSSSSSQPVPATERSNRDIAGRQADDRLFPERAPSNVHPEKQRQMAFLNRIREADPQFRTIDRAVMNEQNELGIVLDRNVSMDDIPALMRTLIKQMAAEFPGQDLTVLAYAPSNPPMLIGTGRLNAQTRDMTYTPAQPTANRF